MKVSDLNTSEFDAYYGRYINKVPSSTELVKCYILDETNVIEFFDSIPENKLAFRYRPEKWCVKEIYQHLVDTERVFLYRCFRIARHDKTALAGFDQIPYIEPSRANEKSIAALTNEFKAQRQSSIAMLSSFTDDDLKCVGQADGFVLSARAAAFTIIGHNVWHIEVIKEKYLQ